MKGADHCHAYDYSFFIGDLFYFSGWIKNYTKISVYLKTTNLMMLAFLDQSGMLPNSRKHIYTKLELETMYEVDVIGI